MSLQPFTKIVFFIFLVFSVPAFSQMAQKLVKKAEHTVNLHYGFSYAADVESNRDRRQALPGFGYQYTNKKNWYFGADFQYDRNKRPDYYLSPATLDGAGFYTYRSAKIPGGIGYFTETSYLVNELAILTSDSVFITPLDQYPVAKNLQTERYNFFIHGGKRWQKNKNQLEAGLTLQATYVRSFIESVNSEWLAIPAVEKSTGIQKAYFDAVRWVRRDERTRLVPGVGFHLRYDYTLKPRLSIGIQSLASGSEEGLFFQIAPRLVYKL